MKRFLCIILIFFSLFSNSQQKEIDSLTSRLQSYPEENLDRLNSLNELAWYYSAVNPKKGLIFSDKAITLAKKIERNDKLAIAYKNKAQNYHATSQDSLAMLMYDAAITIQKKLGKPKAIGKITFNKGLIYFGQSKYELADKCNKEAYRIFEKENDSVLMGIVLNSMGINQMYRSLYPEALETYLKAARIYENRNNTKNQSYAGILTNIGILYTRLKKPIIALEYYNKGLAVCREVKYNLGIANALTNIGNLYDNADKPEKALDYYNEAYLIMKDMNNLFGIASALTNIGITHINLKNYDKAVVELTNSITLFEGLDNTHNLAIVHQNIGLALLENPRSNSIQFNKAKNHFEKALNYAREINSIQSEANILENLSKLRVKLKDYKSAYLEQLEAIKLKDSFLSTEKKEEIAKLESRYEYQKKEALLQATHDKEQALKEGEITRQKFIKNTSIIGGSGLVFASIIGFVLYRRKQEAVSKSKEAEFNAKVSDTELKALRSQMNPHFIFNSLNSIGDYILKNDTQSASDYLSKFAKLMRLTLENSEKKEILLSEDISLLRTYLDIERKRFTNNFDYKIEVDTDLDAENILVPPMILQPFIENSIIHGLSQKAKAGSVEISFKANGNMLICSVDDNGIGRQNAALNETNSEHKSMGMAITKSRIEIINKLKNTKGNVEIIDKPEGTKINVSLPMQLAY